MPSGRPIALWSPKVIVSVIACRRRGGRLRGLRGEVAAARETVTAALRGALRCGRGQAPDGGLRRGRQVSRAAAKAFSLAIWEEVSRGRGC